MKLYTCKPEKSDEETLVNFNEQFIEISQFQLALILEKTPILRQLSTHLTIQRKENRNGSLLRPSRDNKEEPI